MQIKTSRVAFRSGEARERLGRRAFDAPQAPLDRRQSMVVAKSSSMTIWRSRRQKFIVSAQPDRSKPGDTRVEMADHSRPEVAS
ncbi:conserved hypothetical protein [Histoplasma capsulatum var. duboisii H88]|uniref:Uncharacterized protein n=1 Tax=Ajellomyces capsulatus (strain H88) TaxID=544711 RepID=F0USV2_AJEC8|nr:conserved hypothetical protein [Histoplasma capsulatum var. duboisii H88]QSS54575.1 hypothetical protein I7I53_02165 [Histoplasma capsulatum var. duboisii H88]